MSPCRAIDYDKVRNMIKSKKYFLHDKSKKYFYTAITEFSQNCKLEQMKSESNGDTFIFNLIYREILTVNLR